MRRLVFLLPGLLFLGLAGYFAAALLGGRDPQALPSALIDKPAPDFALEGMQGNPGLSRASLAGHVAVVNFFASWCVPCRIEHPVLMRLAGEGIALYGINYKDKPEDAATLLRNTGNPYAAIGADRQGRTFIDFGAYGVPETYVIDKTGRIRQRFVGPLTGDIIQRELLPLLRALEAS
jgi:cytochrome c biogenesis protein CcmG/thiol:disulfide interchange protein DsbE